MAKGVPNRIVPDQYGLPPLPSVSLFGDGWYAQRINQVAASFQYNIPTLTHTVTTATTGSVTQDTGSAIISSGADPDGVALLQTKDYINYYPTYETEIWFAGSFTQGVGGSIQYVGQFDDDNGFYIGFNGAEFVVARRSGGIDVQIPRTDWNRDKVNGSGQTEFIIDFTKSNVYRIRYGWLGSAPVVFEVLTPKGVWTPMHVMEIPNTTVVPSISQPSNPLRAEVRKTSGAGVVTMRINCWAGGSAGEDHSQEKAFSLDNTKTISANTNTNILTIRSKTTYAGQSNRVRVRLEHFGIACDGTKNVTFKIVKNTTLGGVPNYTSVDTTNSVIEYDTAGTTVTGGTNEHVVVLGKTDSDNRNVYDLELDLRPGETYTFAAYSTSTSDVTVGIRWVELF